MVKKSEQRKLDFEELVKKLGVPCEITDKRFWDSKAAVEPILGLLCELVERPRTTVVATIATEDTTPATPDATAPVKEILLSPKEQEILTLLKEKSQRFKEIRDSLKMSDGNTYNYLRSLQEKGLVKKEVFGHKHVVYFAP